MAAVVLGSGALWALAPSSPSGPRLGAGEAHAPAIASALPQPAVASDPPNARGRPPSPSTPSSLPDTEGALMAELRRVKESDPVRAEELARAGNARFPNSADAPERASVLIHALAAQGRASDARGEAEDMVNRYPISSWVLEIEAFTGAHRHGDVHLTDAGQLVMD